MAHATRKDTPINLRALPDQKKLIDMGAALAHKNRSDFMLEAACREAENLLLDQRLFLLDDKSHQEFVDALDASIDENLGLKALLKNKSPWEK